MMNMISRQLVKHQASNEASIVLGDFNSKWASAFTHRGVKALNSWAEAAGLANGQYEVAMTLKLQLLTRVTSDGGTWIDDILHTDRQNKIHCIGAHTVQGSAWMTISDHSLIWAHYVLPSIHAPTTTPPVKVAPRNLSIFLSLMRS